MSRKAKEVSEIFQVNLRAGWKELTAVINWVISLLGDSADAIVNVTAVELRFWAVVLTKKLMFDIISEKIDVAGSHLSIHGDAICLFVVITTEWKAIECEY